MDSLFEILYLNNISVYIRRSCFDSENVHLKILINLESGLSNKIT